MIKHVVLWRLQEESQGKTKKENAGLLKQKLEALKGMIPEILELEVGLSYKTGETVSDVALYSSFKNPEALEIYQNHPEHVKVAAFVKQITAERRVVDYEI